MRFTLSPNVTWPLFITGLLLLSIGMGVSAVLAARSDGGAQTVPDYYTRALHYDETLHADAQSAATGWQVTLDAGAEIGGLRTLAFRLVDDAGAPVADAEGEIRIRRPSKIGVVARVPFHATADGYAVGVPAMTPGLWDVTVVARRGTTVFETTQRVEVDEQ